MKRFIFIALLILTVTMSAATADTFRFSNYGGSLVGSNMFDGYTRVSVSGGGDQMALYNSPSQFYLGTSSRTSSYQVRGSRPVQGFYQNNGYYSPSYGSLQLNQVQYRGETSSFAAFREPVTNTWGGSGGFGRYVGAPQVRYAPSNIGYAGGSQLLTVPAQPRTGMRLSTGTASVARRTAYR